MLKDAVQGRLEVASQQEEIEPQKQLIELSLRNRFLVSLCVRLLNAMDGI
ncbi:MULTISPECIES: hypothetical protein [Nostocales]|nr:MULTISPECIES: hypothetical protein [Nostocales]MBO1066289.1 hypothetical protein [Anabaena sp. 54]